MTATASPPSETRTSRVALIGNPNTGKTTLFNALTGLNHRTGNYPGVTVEKKTGMLDERIEIIDLPGTYSLAAHSPDEMVSVDLLLGNLDKEPRPDLAVVIVDASNLARNLYLVTQVMELGLPVIVVLNMADAAQNAGVTISEEGLSSALGVPVVSTIANRGEGLSKLKDNIKVYLKAEAPNPPWHWPDEISKELDTLTSQYRDVDFLLTRALIDEASAAETAIKSTFGGEAVKALAEARSRIKAQGRPPAALEAKMRYAWIDEALRNHTQKIATGPSASDRADAILTHRFFGTFLFAGLMILVFMTIFEWAGPIMDLVDTTFAYAQEIVGRWFAGSALEGGMLHSLLVDGIIGGVGSVLIFLPQILFLFMFIAILEDCGYMARAAFLMDRLLRFCGLSGHSFIPMMSSFACAIPGVMAARTIANPRDRITTILVAPLMSCSARIPVYVIMTAAFVPAIRIGGFLSLQGLVFAGMYFVGILVAIPVAFLFKRTLLKGPTPPFVLELPAYKRPDIKTVLIRVLEAGKAFVIRAGTIIFMISVIIWGLNYFPHADEISQRFETQRTEAKTSLKASVLEERLAEIDNLEAGAHQRNSYFATMGHFVEPAFRPLGWDWKISMATLAAFPAREVIVSTLGIIYNLGGDLDVNEEKDRTLLIQQLKASTWPDGRKVFSLPVALSIMVFFALCCQCGATIATIRRETNSWKWAGFSFAYMTILAYVGALLTYQIGSLIG